MHVPSVPAVLLLGIYSSDIVAKVHSDLGAKLAFVAIYLFIYLLVIANSWKKPKVPSVGSGVPHSGVLLRDTKD